MRNLRLEPIRGRVHRTRKAVTVQQRIPFRVQPMLATLVPEPFDRPGWAYEEKYDGVRILAYKQEGRIRLLSRNEKDRTENFPRIAAAIRILQPFTLLLDGEVVVFDEKRVSRFQLLQQDKGEPLKVKVRREDGLVIAGYTKARWLTPIFWRPSPRCLSQEQAALCRQSGNRIRSEISPHAVSRISTTREISACAAGPAA